MCFVFPKTAWSTCHRCSSLPRVQKLRCWDKQHTLRLMCFQKQNFAVCTQPWLSCPLSLLFHFDQGSLLGSGPDHGGPLVQHDLTCQNMTTWHGQHSHRPRKSRPQHHQRCVAIHSIEAKPWCWDDSVRGVTASPRYGCTRCWMLLVSVEWFHCDSPFQIV